MSKTIAALCVSCGHRWRTSRTKTPFPCPRCKRHTGYGRPLKPSKYRNQRVTVEGVEFDSKKEAARWVELQAAERAGQIWDLRRQVRFPLDVNGTHICDYVADFEWKVQMGSCTARIVEDVKGRKTREYGLKKRLMRALYGVEIKET